jgi:hypothetical protein
MERTFEFADGSQCLTLSLFTIHNSLFPIPVLSGFLDNTQIERYIDAVVTRTCLNEAVGCVLVHLIHIKNAQQSLTQWVY